MLIPKRELFDIRETIDMLHTVIDSIRDVENSKMCLLAGVTDNSLKFVINKVIKQLLALESAFNEIVDNYNSETYAEYITDALKETLDKYCEEV